MNTWETYLFKDWDKICQNVKRGLEKLGHNIPLTTRDYEKDTPITKDEIMNEKYIKTGEMVSWSNSINDTKEKTGMVVAVIPKGESAMRCVPRNIKKGRAKFQDISKVDRVLIAVSDGPNDNQLHYFCPSYGKVKTSVRRANRC